MRDDIPMVRPSSLTATFGKNNDVVINMNAGVKVKLTTHGVDILRKKHDELNEFSGGALGPFELRLDEDGYYVTQLWTLMQDFGSNIGLVKKPAFENTIIIQDW